MWERYVTEGIMPFCAGHPAALIADSHSPHISDLSVSLAADYNISCIQSPPGTTAALQPNDVGEDGGLNRKSKADYLDKIRSHIGRPDGRNNALARYLGCWQWLDRDWIREAWVDSNPLLRETLSKGRCEGS
jgi:hypothetical protein